MIAIIDFILWVSASVCLVSFFGYFYADYKKNQISHHKGRLLAPEEIHPLQVNYDSEGKPEPVYADTDEQIKWDLYASLFAKGFWWSFGIMMLMTLLLNKLGIIEDWDRPLDDRY